MRAGEEETLSSRLSDPSDLRIRLFSGENRNLGKIILSGHMIILLSSVRTVYVIHTHFGRLHRLHSFRRSHGQPLGKPDIFVHSVHPRNTRLSKKGICLPP